MDPSTDTEARREESGILGEIALFLGREVGKIDSAISPKVVKGFAEIRRDWRLEGEGLRQLGEKLKYDVTLLLYEYQRLMSGGGEVPPPPPAPGGDLVNIRGAQTRPDLPAEEQAPPEDPLPEPGTEGYYRSGQKAARGNFRCIECDAVITQSRVGLLPACDCGGQGWWHLE